MNNERGITLVELLGALAIIGLLIALLTKVFLNGITISDRGVTQQKLQQEANYIVEMIRKEYLKLEDEKIIIEVNNDSQQLKIDGLTISSGYTYCYENDCQGTQTIEIDREYQFQFSMELKKGDKLSYTIETTFSKLH